MEKSRSKRKGNSFENKILRELRKIHPDTYKALGSGNAKDDKGDIIFGRYLIECKHHKRFSRNELQKYFEKVDREADSAEKIAVLVFKENRRDTMVLTWGDRQEQVMYYFDNWLNEASHE